MSLFDKMRWIYNAAKIAKKGGECTRKRNLGAICPYKQPKRSAMEKEQLDFITFCVGNLADELNMSASEVYGALRISGVLNDYIIPCYDVLHTFGKEYLMEDLIDLLKKRGAIA